MDETEFRQYLKRGGRAPRATDRVLAHLRRYEDYLAGTRGGLTLDQAAPEDLEAFVDWVEREPRASAKTYLWAIRYYYAWTGNDDLHHLAGILREERIERAPFPLAKFRGVDPAHCEALAAAGIKHVRHMIESGRTPGARQALAARTGVPLETIVELVKLSDLARIPGIKGVRARLYHDAGVDTIEKLAAWEPEALRAMIVDFAERTGFDGIATLPAEARSAVRQAQKLPKVVEYE